MPNRDKHVRSFDVFDTLITRRCAKPHDVFRLVEQESGILGFAAARVRAEVNVENSAYTIDEIYAELPELLGLDPSEAEQLKSLELKFEREQTIPIEENLRLVRDGDLLVSDMYLHPAHISELLSVAGLNKEIELHVSSAGKRNGTIWPKILKEHQISEHLGDNRIGDFKSPKRFGIPSRLTNSHAMTKTEKAFLSAGLPQLAQVAREVRLRTWNDNKQIRELEAIQASLNLPFLLVASVWLKNFAESAGYTKILMSSRDCRIWQGIFDKVCEISGSSIESEYFYTSRVARMNPSESYISYASSKFVNGSLWVDLCGTGWSMWSLLHQLSLSGQPIQLLHPTDHKPSYAGLEQFSSGPQFDRALIHSHTKRVKNSLLEMCNQALDPMTRDVEEVAGNFSPIFAEDRRSRSKPLQHKLIRPPSSRTALHPKSFRRSNRCPLSNSITSPHKFTD